MNVLILGSGAMGCLYGAAFHRAGCAVTLVDVNREHVDAINARGLELERRSGTELLPIPAHGEGAFDEGGMRVVWAEVPLAAAESAAQAVHGAFIAR